MKKRFKVLSPGERRAQARGLAQAGSHPSELRKAIQALLEGRARKTGVELAPGTYWRRVLAGELAAKRGGREGKLTSREENAVHEVLANPPFSQRVLRTESGKKKLETLLERRGRGLEPLEAKDRIRKTIVYNPEAPPAELLRMMRKQKVKTTLQTIKFIRKEMLSEMRDEQTQIGLMKLQGKLPPDYVSSMPPLAVERKRGTGGAIK